MAVIEDVNNSEDGVDGMLVQHCPVNAAVNTARRTVVLDYSVNEPMVDQASAMH